MKDDDLPDLTWAVRLLIGALIALVLLFCGLYAMRAEAHDTDYAGAPLIECAATPCPVQWVLPSVVLNGAPVVAADILQTIIRWGHCPYTVGQPPAVNPNLVEPELHRQHSVDAPATTTALPIAAGTIWCAKGFVVTRSGYASEPSTFRIVVTSSRAGPDKTPGRLTITTVPVIP